MTPKELLISGAQELGVTLSNHQVDAFFIYFSELGKWNRSINLTTIREESDVIIKHGLDSLSFLKGFSPVPQMALLDIGSGAGFPALPIKISHTELRVAMVESVKKKASFLRHMIRTLRLQETDVIDKRTEELPDAYRSVFDVVTARAFADIKSALLVGLPFLKPGGLMILSKGPGETISEPDATKIGFSVRNAIGLTLPHSDYKRTVWVFEKTI